MKIWIKSKRQKPLIDIAEEIGVSPSIIRKWKHLDQWDDIPITPPKRGAPPGNQNAVGNRGGKGAPEGNRYGMKHGLFTRFLPDEVQEIMEELESKDPLDMIWDSIQLQYAIILRAQKIMFVRDQNDLTKELKRKKDSNTSEEREYEIQFAWDKHAQFMKAQSTAFAALQSLIRRYEDMLRTGNADEEQKLRIHKLKSEIQKIENDNQRGDNVFDITKPEGLENESDPS